MDHDILIAEQAHLAHMPSEDRQKLKNARRQQQIEKYHQFESTFPIFQRLRKIKFQVPSNFALIAAVKQQDVKEVKKLLKNGTDPNTFDFDGVTLLHMQALYGESIEIAKILLEYGADIDAVDSEKWTPLHAAACFPNIEMIKFLIKNGANLLAVTNENKLPIDLCEDAETSNLIEAEMACHGITEDQMEAARKASELQMLEDMKKLVQAGENLNARDQQDGTTYLHIAAANGYESVVKYLLKNGAIPRLKNPHGIRAADLAHENGYKYIAKYINKFKQGDILA